jgi:hypothetical protein
LILGFDVGDERIQPVISKFFSQVIYHLADIRSLAVWRPAALCLGPELARSLFLDSHIERLSVGGLSSRAFSGTSSRAQVVNLHKKMHIGAF